MAKNGTYKVYKSLRPHDYKTGVAPVASPQGDRHGLLETPMSYSP